jgi:solute:Na+ symporter, SSS family
MGFPSAPSFAVSSAGFRRRCRYLDSMLDFAIVLAGETLKWWQAGTSMAATQFAADTSLRVRGLVATVGVFAVWRLWVYQLAFLLMAFLFVVHPRPGRGGLGGSSRWVPSPWQAR